MPVGVGHEDEKIVVADAGIVNQNFNAVGGVSIFPAFHCSFYGLWVCHIAREKFARTTMSFDLCECFACGSFVADIIDEYGPAGLRQSQADGATYAARAASDEGVLHGKSLNS